MMIFLLLPLLAMEALGRARPSAELGGSQPQCKTVYDDKCHFSYSNQCETKVDTYTETQCSKGFRTAVDVVHDETCNVRYVDKCVTKVETVYDEQCHFVYKDVCEDKFSQVHETVCQVGPILHLFWSRVLMSC